MVHTRIWLFADDNVYRNFYSGIDIAQKPTFIESYSDEQLILIFVSLTDFFLSSQFHSLIFFVILSVWLGSSTPSDKLLKMLIK